MSGKTAVDKKRYVQIGRVCLINFGSQVNKLVVILNIIDGRRVLVEGPTSGVPRQSMSLLRLALTPIAIAIPRNSRLGVLRKAYEAAKVDEKWNQSAWAKKIAQRDHREKMTDLDRFKVAVARRALAKASRGEFNKLKKAKFPPQPKKSRKAAKAAPKKKAAAPAATKAAPAKAAAPAKGAPKTVAAKGKAK